MLFAPVLAMVIVAFALAALLGALFGTRATHYLVQQLVAKSTDSLQAHLQRFLEKPHLAARVNADAMSSGQVDVHSLFHRPERWFLERHQQFPEVDDIYFGRTDGAIVGVDKLADRRVLKITTEFPRRSFFELDREGRRGSVVGGGNYDATQRGWYRTAVGTKGPVWSDIYVLQNRGELGISAAHPATDPAGRLVGVMGVNLTLKSLSDYLRDHPVGARSVAYIVEPGGLLVATSGSPGSLVKTEGPERSRTMAAQSEDRVVVASHEALRTMANAGSDARMEPLEIVVDKQPLWVYRTRYSDPLGLDWRLVTVVDPAPFLHSVHQVATVTLVLGALALASLLLMLPRITRRMAAPLEQLAQASSQLAQGRYGVSVAVRDGGREVDQLVSAFNDMSQRLGEAHQRLQSSAEQLEVQVKERTAELSHLNALYQDERNRAHAASENKTRFLTHLSHELRTPLNGIAGLAYLAREDHDVHLRNERLSTIENASRYVARIIDSVLDLSKIEAGRLELAYESVDVHAIVNTVMHMVEPDARSKGLQLRSQVANLPAHLLGDGMRLQQCLLNLVHNAVRVTAKGHVEVEVKVLSEDVGAAVLRFNVADTGPGVTSAELEPLFDPYARGTAGHGGAGLGLAITRGLATVMRGVAGASSEPGKGSLFYFTARLDRGPEVQRLSQPAAATAAAELSNRHEGRAGVHDHVNRPAVGGPARKGLVNAADLKAALQHRSAPPQVLVVDDDPVNQIVAEGILARAGIRMTAASSGAEGLALAADQPFDLILMDVTMPDMDGMEVTRCLRAQGRHIATPILAFTGLAFEDDRQRCLDAGMSDFVSKPLDPAVFFAKLWDLLVGPASTSVTPTQ